MMRHTRLRHQFVHYIPERLEPGVLYVSVDYCTAVHSCCCGCGQEVVTPLSPAGWKLIFDGATVSLSPSVGNWNFKCRSHYFIREGRVIEVGRWTSERSPVEPRDTSELELIEIDEARNGGTWSRIKGWLTKGRRPATSDRNDKRAGSRRRARNGRR